LVFALERRRATSLIRRWALWTLSGIAAVAAVSVIAAVTTCAGLVFPGMALAVSSAVLAIANVIPGSLLELREVPTA
jgi:Zn-dependent protease